MKYPDWDDGSILAKMTKEYVPRLGQSIHYRSTINRFRERFVRLAGHNNVRRFAALSEDYTECVAHEAELRERGEVLTLDEFIPLRRNNSAVLLCYSLVEYILGIDLPDEVFEDEDFADAYWAAADMVCWSNVRLQPCT